MREVFPFAERSTLLSGYIFHTCRRGIGCVYRSEIPLCCLCLRAALAHHAVCEGLGASSRETGRGRMPRAAARWFIRETPANCGSPCEPFDAGGIVSASVRPPLWAQSPR